MSETLLDIKNLHVWFKVYGGVLKVLNGVNFNVKFGEKVGLVGEAGCVPAKSRSAKVDA